MLSPNAKRDAYFGHNTCATSDKREWRIGGRSEKGFNSTTIGVKSKAGAGCLSPAIYKDGINWRRINKETNRRNLAEAQFVNVPVLVMPDGTGRIPLSFHRKGK